jgi:hypothetical protein
MAAHIFGDTAQQSALDGVQTTRAHDDERGALLVGDPANALAGVLEGLTANLVAQL